MACDAADTAAASRSDAGKINMRIVGFRAGGFQLGEAFIHMKRAGKGEPRIHS